MAVSVLHSGSVSGSSWIGEECRICLCALEDCPVHLASELFVMSLGVGQQCASQTGKGKDAVASQWRPTRFWESFERALTD
eukprot:2283953-Amphidinium_carterae.1